MFEGKREEGVLGGRYNAAENPHLRYPKKPQKACLKSSASLGQCGVKGTTFPCGVWGKAPQKRTIAWFLFDLNGARFGFGRFGEADGGYALFELGFDLVNVDALLDLEGAAEVMELEFEADRAIFLVFCILQAFKGKLLIVKRDVQIVAFYARKLGEKQELILIFKDIDAWSHKVTLMDLFLFLGFFGDLAHDWISLYGAKTKADSFSFSLYLIRFLKKRVSFQNRVSEDLLFCVDGDLTGQDFLCFFHGDGQDAVLELSGDFFEVDANGKRDGSGELRLGSFLSVDAIAFGCLVFSFASQGEGFAIGFELDVFLFHAGKQDLKLKRLAEIEEIHLRPDARLEGFSSGGDG